MVLTGQLVRLAPDGRVDRVIRMPVTNPTCPAFGGDDLGTLYVTSHSQRLAPEVLAAEPLAGGLFALDVGVRGLPEPRFQG
jgi:sugar lactone lactonase YvrE